MVSVVVGQPHCWLRRDMAQLVHEAELNVEDMPAGMSKAELQAALMDSERRLAEKHSRLEGAVVQVTRLPVTLSTAGQFSMQTNFFNMKIMS